MLYINITSQYMSQLSIALSAQLEERISQELAYGDFESKSELVKKAITSYLRDLAYKRLLQSEKEYAAGEYLTLRGTLADHLKKTRV